MRTFRRIKNLILMRRKTLSESLSYEEVWDKLVDLYTQDIQIKDIQIKDIQIKSTYYDADWSFPSNRTESPAEALAGLEKMFGLFKDMYGQSLEGERQPMINLISGQHQVYMGWWSKHETHYLNVQRERLARLYIDHYDYDRPTKAYKIRPSPEICFQYTLNKKDK